MRSDELCGFLQEAIQDLQNEVTMLENFGDNQFVVKYFGRSTVGGLPAILMEYAPGTLHDHLDGICHGSQHAHFTIAISLIRQIVEAVAFVHDHGVSAGSATQSCLLPDSPSYSKP